MNYLLSESDRAKLNRLLRTMPGDTLEARPPRSAFPDRFPPPYTVRWSQSENDGAGAWVIWLPTRHYLFYWGAMSSMLRGVTACDTLPAGWYTIDSRPSSTSDLYAVMTYNVSTESSGGVTIMSSVPSPTSSTMYFGFLIAKMATDATTGAKTVKQYQTGPIHFSLNGSAGSVALDDVSLDWNEDGAAQIKDFDTGTPEDENTISDYLQGVADIPSTGITFVCRTTNSDGASLFYLPLAALFSGSGVSGNINLGFVGDIRWNMTNHTLEKRVDSVNLRTGAVTPGNWVTITNGETTPITSIIGS